ncbi:hypothetical protein [Agrobacterium fabrum]|uniref:hypothetical protein n=1 Tax=Agrobacterium fabrum TaxID=1176649 RepID=UPI003BA0BE00
MSASPNHSQAIFIALTPLERKALERLFKLHAKFPANSEGFRPASLGPSCAAAARRMEISGYVSVKRVAANNFRYSLTDEGKARANG